jgi:fructose-bisphosphate aldolase class II
MFHQLELSAKSLVTLIYTADSHKRGKRMPLVSVKKLLDDAQQREYAVPSLNCFNLETLEAVVECAEEERSGIVIQFHPSYFQHVTIGSLLSVVSHRAYNSLVPIAVSLDHGSTMQDILLSIRHGMTGVMFDAAHLPLSENIRQVRHVVEYCHPLGISVEAALGHMPHGQQQREEDLADPDEAAELVRATGIDALAPAIGNVHGTAHGEEKGETHLVMDRIQAIAEATRIPLVLHGGSSISEEELREAIRCGIRKVVFFTDLARAFNVALMSSLTTVSVGDNPIHILSQAKQAYKEAARKKMRALGSCGKY